MAPELRLVKGELSDDAPAAHFAPDRTVPVRIAQASAVVAVICGLVAQFAGQSPAITWPLWGATALFGFSFFASLSAALKRASIRYTLSTQRLEIERGLIARRRESLDLFRIRDVVLEQGIVQRLRGLGTITLFSTDQVEPTLAIASIANAQAIYEQLRDAASRARQQRVVQVDR